MSEYTMREYTLIKNGHPMYEGRILVERGANPDAVPWITFTPSPAIPIPQPLNMEGAKDQRPS